MRAIERTIPFLCLAAAALLLSCETQTYQVGDLVNPKITEVSADGKTAKVNIGLFDGVHAGQMLYVVRDNRLAGMLVVRRLDAYSSECTVTASKTEGHLAEAARVRLKDIRAGDLVVREFKEISGAGMIRKKVPRMVPVPWDTDNTTIGVAARKFEDGRQEIYEWKKIPRDQVDAWRKKHPTVKISLP